MRYGENVGLGLKGQTMKTGELIELTSSNEVRTGLLLVSSDSVQVLSCRNGNVLSENNCIQIEFENCKFISKFSDFCVECEDGYYLTDDYSRCTLCNLTYGDNCLSCNSSECFTCEFGYKLSDDHKSCIKATECVMYDGKCVKCNNEKDIKISMNVFNVLEKMLMIVIC